MFASELTEPFSTAYVLAYSDIGNADLLDEVLRN